MNNLLVILVMIICMILGAVVFAFSESNENPKTVKVVESIVGSEFDSRVETDSIERYKIAAEKVVNWFTDSIREDKPVRKLYSRSSNEHVELADRKLVESASRQFDEFRFVSDEEATEPPISVTIKPTNEVQKSGYRSIDIMFENTSDEPVKFLKPVDGSLWGWFPNHYKFTAIAPNGKALGLGGRCGNCGPGNAEWPGEFLVELAPGESHELSCCIPLSVGLATDPAEVYSVSFEYIYEFGEDATAKFRDGFAEPVEGVWQGVAKSNTLEITLQPQPQTQTKK